MASIVTVASTRVARRYTTSVLATPRLRLAALVTIQFGQITTTFLTGEEPVLFFRKEQAGPDQAPIVVEYASPTLLGEMSIEALSARLRSASFSIFPESNSSGLAVWSLILHCT